MDTPLLPPTNKEDLLARGLLVHVRDGTDRIHKKLIRQLVWGPLVTSTEPEWRSVSRNIPEFLVSRETLRFMGFSSEGATHVWNHWLKRPIKPRTKPVMDTLDPLDVLDELADFAVAFVTYHWSVPSDFTDANEVAMCMARCGLGSHFIDTLVGDDFAEDRVNPATCLTYWANCKRAIEGGIKCSALDLLTFHLSGTLRPWA